MAAKLRQEATIDLEELEQLFLSPETSVVTQLNKPSGGEVYVFQCSKASAKDNAYVEDWRADGYRWVTMSKFYQFSLIVK